MSRLIREYKLHQTKTNKIIPAFWCNKCGGMYKTIHVVNPVGGKWWAGDNLDLCDLCIKDTFKNE